MNRFIDRAVAVAFAMSRYARLPVLFAAVILTGPAPGAMAQGHNGQGHNGQAQNAQGLDDQPRRLPPAGKAPEKLDLDEHGQLKQAPDTARDGARERLALRALLRRRPGQHVPDNADQRFKLLDLLYGHLARTKDRSLAKRLVAAIERVWRHSGSDTVSLLMHRAARAEKKKDYAKALEFLDLVVKMAPDFTEAWNRRAYVHFKNKDYVRAMGDLRRVLALDPNHFKALEGLGQILRESDDKYAALQVFRRLVEVYPAHKSARDTRDKLARDVLGQKS